MERFSDELIVFGLDTKFNAFAILFVSISVLLPKMDEANDEFSRFKRQKVDDWMRNIPPYFWRSGIRYPTLLRICARGSPFPYRFACLSTSHNVRTTMMLYEKEVYVAQLAVQRAALVAQRVFWEKNKGVLSKTDDSPVTIGDFAAQAVIISAIRKNFPQDQIVGEEEARPLRENKNLTNQIWELVRSANLQDEKANITLGGPIQDVERMLQLIDEGDSPGGPKGRIWALDPIDGTKGFLRGGQYAVCLALIEDGDVKVGVIGCPNLPIDDKVSISTNLGVHLPDASQSGVLFSAVAGAGAMSRPLNTSSLQEGCAIHMKEIADISQATFCESVEAQHSSHSDHAQIAKKLGITRESVRMDSQAKYGTIARGAADLYLRLPINLSYQEKIWDHAAGDLIVREAGGQVTDVEGKQLDFGKGRTLSENRGVIAAPLAVHKYVLEAVKSVLGSK